MRTKGRHRQYRHPNSPKVITVAGHPNDDAPVGTLKSILRKAGPS
ncbi:MAG: type II toxin-antitoxin system HicA family toxin [Acidobacteriia bacterium]|nr:type II toxin-antitoxin system HicA family toxin [Terriglobia bacterium]